MTPPIVVMWLLFFLLAWRRFRMGAFTLDPKAWRIARAFGLGLLGLVCAGCSTLFFYTNTARAFTLAGKTILAAAPEILAAWILLLAALSGPRRRVYRVFPSLDRCSVAKSWLSRPRSSINVGATRKAFFAKSVETIAYLCAMLAFSAVWLRLAVADSRIGARLSPELTDWFQKGLSESGDAFVVSAAILAFLAPFTEEAIFRGFALREIATLLDRRRAGTSLAARIASVVITAALWSACHSGTIEPGWAKWVQILGIGCVLGIARLRLGVEVCILLHLAFNHLGGYFMPNELIVPFE